MAIEVTYLEDGADRCQIFRNTTPREAAQAVRREHPGARNIWCRFVLADDE